MVIYLSAMFLLAPFMRSCGEEVRLKVDMEGRLTEDNCIGCCEIDSQPTSSGRKAEHKDIGTDC
jgi:hypothetical protein